MRDTSRPGLNVVVDRRPVQGSEKPTQVGDLPLSLGLFNMELIRGRPLRVFPNDQRQRINQFLGEVGLCSRRLTKNVGCGAVTVKIKRQRPHGSVKPIAQSQRGIDDPFDVESGRTCSRQQFRLAF